MPRRCAFTRQYICRRRRRYFPPPLPPPPIYIYLILDLYLAIDSQGILMHYYTLKYNFECAINRMLRRKGKRLRLRESAGKGEIRRTTDCLAGGRDHKTNRSRLDPGKPSSAELQYSPRYSLPITSPLFEGSASLCMLYISVVSQMSKRTRVSETGWKAKKLETNATCKKTNFVGLLDWKTGCWFG